MSRRILLTAALPYANGDIHLGHLVEYLQADIWARFQKLRGNECYFICADDAHGTPVMLRAQAENISAEKLIVRMRENHLRDFSGFHVDFDCYHSTHSDENKILSTAIFRRLRDNGHIAVREVRQLYDQTKGMFLPDRYVQGRCPKCDADSQHGDSCERCGAAYAPTDLKEPRSILSGEPPTLRSSRHYFFRLSAMSEELRQWTQEHIADPAAPGRQIPRLQKEAANKMREWLNADLRDWDISRDAPYFGFRIPDIDEEKYFYVWLDAPVGYMASFRRLCTERNLSFDDFWHADNEQQTELYHFIGKDILYFHALFWPAMLTHSGHRRPTRLFVHGFLIVNGEKMSKSRGTFITARHYLDCGLNPEFLRYYYACKLNDRVEDLDLSLHDFILRTNGDLVGKLVNIPSRVAGFLHKFFAGALDSQNAEGAHFTAAVAPVLAVETQVAEAMENRRYQEAMRLIMQAAATVNAHIDACAPWQAAKEERYRDELHAVCSAAMRAFHLLMTMLQPVLPEMAAAAEKIMNIPLQWRPSLQPLPAGHTIRPYRHLIKRMTESNVNALIQPAAAGGSAATLDDFAKIDLRVAVVTAAAAVAGADKLLRLSLDIGDGQPRQVLAGIKAHCTADALVGQKVVYFANLKSRSMRFGDSEGMVLAAGNDSGVWLLQAPNDAPPGAKIR